MKAFFSLTLGVLVAVAIVSCGDDNKSSDETAQPATGGAAQTLSVTETDFKIDPANPTVDQPGELKIDVRNDGEVVHALEVDGPSGEFKTEDIQPGESATLTANLSDEGSYEWYCPIGNHRDLGMEGELRVGGGSGTGTGTTETGTTETNTTTTGTTETGTTETGTTETEPGDDSGGSGGSGSGSSGTGGSGGY